MTQVQFLFCHMKRGVATKSVLESRESQMICEWIETIASVSSLTIRGHHLSYILFNDCVIVIAGIILRFRNQYTLISLHGLACKVFSFMLHVNLTAQLKPIPTDQIQYLKVNNDFHVSKTNIIPIDINNQLTNMVLHQFLKVFFVVLVLFLSLLKHRIAP